MKQKLIEILQANKENDAQAYAEVTCYLEAENYVYAPGSFEEFASEMEYLFVEPALIEMLFSLYKNVVLDDELNEYKENIQKMFITAMSMSNIRTMEFLVEAGADVHAFKENGKLPIHYAVQCCSLETIKCLLKLGADADINRNAKDTRGNEALGKNALFHLFYRVDTESAEPELILKFLISKGADVDVTIAGQSLIDWFGDSALKPIIQQALDTKPAQQNEEVVEASHDAAAASVTEEEFSSKADASSSEVVEDTPSGMPPLGEGAKLVYSGSE